MLPKAPMNPRGTLWSKDENRFGFRMLERMGWKKGKGLGYNEDGIVEPVKVRQKYDAKGVGFKDRDDQWTAHHDAFNALLTHLNGSNVTSPVQPAIMSLEKKSRNAKSRVHYHKFARGKDLSHCTEVDLTCVLGKSKQKDNEDIVKIAGQLNIQEYFAQKAALLPKTEKDQGILSKKVQETEKNELSALVSVEKRRKSHEKVESSCALGETAVINDHISYKKKKRKHKDQNEEELHSGDLQLLEDAKSSGIDNYAVTEKPSHMHKRKKAKIFHQEPELQNMGNKDAPTENSHSCCENGTDMVDEILLKSKKKHKLGSRSSENLQSLIEDIGTMPIDARCSKEAKRARKQCAKHISDTEQDAKFKELKEDQKKLKKSKKIKHLEAVIDDQSNGEIVKSKRQEEIDALPIQHSSSKKAKTLELKCVENRSDLQQNVEMNDSEEEHKQHKKPKKSRKATHPEIKIEALNDGETVERSSQDEVEIISKRCMQVKRAKNAEMACNEIGNHSEQVEETESLKVQKQQIFKQSRKARRLEATVEEPYDGDTTTVNKQKYTIEEEKPRLQEIKQRLGDKSKSVLSSKTHMSNNQMTSPKAERLPLLYWRNVDKLMSQKPKTVKHAETIVELLRKADPFRGSNLFEIDGYGTPQDEYVKPVTSRTNSKLASNAWAHQHSTTRTPTINRRVLSRPASCPPRIHRMAVRQPNMTPKRLAFSAARRLVQSAHRFSVSRSSPAQQSYHTHQIQKMAVMHTFRMPTYVNVQPRRVPITTCSTTRNREAPNFPARGNERFTNHCTRMVNKLSEIPRRAPHHACMPKANSQVTSCSCCYSPRITAPPVRQTNRMPAQMGVNISSRVVHSAHRPLTSRLPYAHHSCCTHQTQKPTVRGPFRKTIWQGPQPSRAPVTSYTKAINREAFRNPHPTHTPVSNRNMTLRPGFRSSRIQETSVKQSWQTSARMRVNTTREIVHSSYEPLVSRQAVACTRRVVHHNRGGVRRPVTAPAWQSGQYRRVPVPHTLVTRRTESAHCNFHSPQIHGVCRCH